MEKMPKNAKSFVCNDCDFKCYKQSNYDKHLTTSKHKNRTNLDILEQKMPKDADQLFMCECGRKYSARNSLWYHKQKCKIENTAQEHTYSKTSAEPSDKDLIMLLIKENSGLKNMMMEQSNILMGQSNMMMKVLENGTHNTTNNNSHNKSFNLNLFLNETCKDAMNITEFVESIKLQLSDLERVGELGYVEGISNIIVKNLKDLDVTQRPVHCTDKKRETMYIKDENKWEKDDEQKKMHKLVRKVADKNARMLPKFKEAHPDCLKSSSRFSDQYNKIIMEAMGGRGDNDFEKEEKIIKRVSKEVIVDKEP
jgi:hypothetical protein